MRFQLCQESKRLSCPFTPRWIRHTSRDMLPHMLDIISTPLHRVACTYVLETVRGAQSNCTKYQPVLSNVTVVFGCCFGFVCCCCCCCFVVGFFFFGFVFCFLFFAAAAAAPTVSMALLLRRPPRKIWGSNPACDWTFPGQVIPVTQKLALQWLPCQASGVIGSALGLVGPLSVYCEWPKNKI